MADFPKQLEELIERFDRNIESYSNQAYNETQVRRAFIDPFFGALGWDVANKNGYAEAYKDVIHEDAISRKKVTLRRGKFPPDVRLLSMNKGISTAWLRTFPSRT